MTLPTPATTHVSIIGDPENTIASLPFSGAATRETPAPLLHVLTTSDSNSLKATSGPITLNVGGRIFCAYRGTLQLYGHIMRHLERWHHSTDPLFLDTDPDLFEHLLRYLRRFEVFPLFWDPVKGFDYDLYHRLEVEAYHYEIDELYKWIRDKRYLEAIKVTRSAPVRESAENTSGGTDLVNVEYERCMLKTKKLIWICPRGIPVHRGNRDACGSACKKALIGREFQYEEEEHVEVVTVKKTTEFDQCVCQL